MKREKGATFLELVIALPAIIFTLYVLYYFGFYLYTRGTINAGLQHGLSLAAVLEDIESEDDQDGDSKTVKNLNARGEVIARAKMFPSTGLVGPGQFAEILDAKLILPDDPSDAYWNPKPSADVSSARKEALQEFPMSMAAKVIFRSPLPSFFAPIEIQLRATGYREPRFVSGVPKAMDCLGNVIGIGPTPTEDACKVRAFCDSSGRVKPPTCDTKSAPPTQFLHKESCSCKCLEPFSVNKGSTCVCGECSNPKHEADPKTCECSCAAKPPSENFTQDPETCAYSCGVVCPDGKKERKEGETCGDCLCTKDPKCKKDEKPLPDNCGCTCRPCKDGVADPQNKCKCKCKGEANDDDENRECECKLTAEKCAKDGKVLDLGNCRCNGCPDPEEQEFKGGVCVCKSSLRDACAAKSGLGYVFTELPNCACLCKNSCAAPRTHPGAGHPNASNPCGCYCSTAQILGCTADGSFLDGGCNCVCTCPGGMESVYDAKGGCHCEISAAK